MRAIFLKDAIFIVRRYVPRVLAKKVIRKLEGLNPAEIYMPEYIEDPKKFRKYCNGMIAMNEVAFRELMQKEKEENDE